jgi:hypothetical protein
MENWRPAFFARAERPNGRRAQTALRPQRTSAWREAKRAERAPGV